MIYSIQYIKNNKIYSKEIFGLTLSSAKSLFKLIYPGREIYEESKNTSTDV